MSASRFDSTHASIVSNVQGVAPLPQDDTMDSGSPPRKTDDRMENTTERADRDSRGSDPAYDEAMQTVFPFLLIFLIFLSPLNCCVRWYGRRIEGRAMDTTQTESLRLTSSEIAFRHSLYGLSHADEANLDRIRFVLREDAAAIVEAFHGHLVGEHELGAAREPRRKLDSLRGAQRRCLMTLGLDAATTAYAEQRLRIGASLERDGVDPKSYLGAYAKLFELLAARLARHYADDAGRRPPCS